MIAHPDLNPVALALLRVLDRGEVRGLRTLSERAAGRPLRTAADLDVLCSYVAAARDLIARGYLCPSSAGASVRFSLSRKGRRTLRPAIAPAWQSRLTWALGTSLFAAGLTGCTPMPVAQPRALLMGSPVMTGLAQVRDLQTGADYFVPCNPCAAPTPKTAVRADDPPAQLPARTAAALPPAPLHPRIVATLAMPAEEQAVPAGSAMLGSEVRPVTVIAEVKTPAVPAAVAPPPTGVRSLPFPSSAFSLDADARRELAALLPLAAKAERVYIRGRTDATGTALGNRNLAIARAATVRAAFAAAGVDPRKLRMSYCTTCFVAPNDTEAGRSANRRVEIELVMPAAAMLESVRPQKAS